MNRQRFAAGSIVIALIALLIYSLDRTGWLFALYERATPASPAAWIGVSPHWIGFAAAIVIEIAAVALVASEGLSSDPVFRRWSNAGLVLVVSVQAVANLLAGFLRGFNAPIVALGATPETPGYSVAVGVAIVAWGITNAAIPAMIFILSKALARVLPAALEAIAPPAQPIAQDRKVDAQPPALDPQPATIDAQDRATGAQDSQGNAQDRKVDAQPPALDPQPATIDAQPEQPIAQDSQGNAQRATIDAQTPGNNGTGRAILAALALRSQNRSWADIARETGIPASTLRHHAQKKGE